MTQAAAILHDLRERGLELYPEAGRIRCRGRKDVLTPALQGIIRNHKAELLAELEASSADHATTSQDLGLPPPDEFPLTTTKPDLTYEERELLSRGLERFEGRDTVGFVRWILGDGGQADRYEASRPEWTPNECDFAALIDILLWASNERYAGLDRQAATAALLDDLEVRELALSPGVPAFTPVEDTPSTGPQDRSNPVWDPEVEELIRWFKKSRDELPTRPFRLTPWQGIADPPTFYDALAREAQAYPQGPRARVLGEELAALRKVVERNQSQPASRKVSGG